MYETNYRFKVYPTSFTTLAMKAIEAHTNISYFQEECRWENCENDLKVVSSRLPDVLISVFGCGEDDGDMWRKDYLNGVEVGSWELDIPEADEKFITCVQYLNNLKE